MGQRFLDDLKATGQDLAAAWHLGRRSVQVTLGALVLALLAFGFVHSGLHGALISVRLIFSMVVASMVVSFLALSFGSVHASHQERLRRLESGGFRFTLHRAHVISVEEGPSGADVTISYDGLDCRLVDDDGRPDDKATAVSSVMPNPLVFRAVRLGAGEVIDARSAQASNSQGSVEMYIVATGGEDDRSTSLEQVLFTFPNWTVSATSWGVSAP